MSLQLSTTNSISSDTNLVFQKLSNLTFTNIVLSSINFYSLSLPEGSIPGQVKLDWISPSGKRSCPSRNPIIYQRSYMYLPLSSQLLNAYQPYTGSLAAKIVNQFLLLGLDYLNQVKDNPGAYLIR